MTSCAALTSLIANGQRSPWRRFVALLPVLAGAAGTLGAAEPPPAAWQTPPDWPFKPTGRMVEALVYTMDGGALNIGGLAAPGIVAVCEAHMRTGLASSVPELVPGYDRPDPYSTITVVTTKGDRLAHFGSGRHYVHQFVHSGALRDLKAYCAAPFAYVDRRVSDRRLFNAQQSAFWTADLTEGRGKYVQTGPGLVPLVPNVVPPALPPRLGAVSLGPSTVAGWQCERWQYPDKHQTCSLTAQPGIPSHVVHLVIEGTPVPSNQPAAQVSFRLTSLTPRVLVDEGIFEPADVPYKRSGTASPEKRQP